MHSLNSLCLHMIVQMVSNRMLNSTEGILPQGACRKREEIQ